jgi:DNA-binding CsgD family transcriptional regulator
MEPEHADRKATAEALRPSALSLREQARRWRLSGLWEALVSGRAHPYDDWVGPTGCYAVVRTSSAPRSAWAPLRPEEARIVTRILRGHQQKAIASDFGLAHSTVSKLGASGFKKLSLAGPQVAVPLVLAAQTPASAVESATTIYATFEAGGESYLAVRVPRPRIIGPSVLSASEREVVLQLIEGSTRREIAAQRATSAYTVSTQLHSIFSKLSLTGRYGAIERGAELGWFREFAPEPGTLGEGKPTER